jgi:hypothetical protein
MPGWTQDDIDRRNLEVFGTDRPGAPAVSQEKPAKVPERLIEAECSKLLSEDGWRILKTDPVSDKSRGKGFGEPGMADGLFMRPLALGPGSTKRDQYACEVLWCEFKAGKNRARKHQELWHIRERARGFMTWIANEDLPATIEGFREHYADSGLMRRPRWW